MDTKVSIIIPVYNGEKYLKKCIDSVLCDKLRDIEIIVVNDGSKDNTESIAKSCIEIDTRVKLINKPNGGSSSARNKGVDIANGEYVFFLDADDFIKKDTIYNIYKKASKYNLDVVVTDIGLYKNISNIEYVTDTNFNDYEIISSDQYLKKIFLGEAITSICNKLWRMELYKNKNLSHTEHISYGEDGATLPRLIINCQRIGKINEMMYFYRIHKSSKMHSNKIKSYQYVEAYNVAMNYLRTKNIIWLKEYEFTYKYNYVYSVLENVFIFSKKYRYNEDYRLLYRDFLRDIKDENNKFIKDNTKRTIKRRFIINSYKFNTVTGEFIKFLFYSISNLKRFINKR